MQGFAAVAASAAARAAVRAPEFHLWPEHVPVLELWGVVGTQWLYAGMGGATGLNYAGVEAAMRLHGVPRAERADRFAELRVMERAALAEWARRAKAREALPPAAG
ncbi:MAG TPA: DUF1799 domain-containing protein [Burkholderiaceae bacterium]|nr:DUF1799 domain-containing protein [Burkholderiaceae bacterium]